jgi:CheY-like chemotaxis protein
LILIADDSPIIQRKAQQILQDEGFEVQTVSNGVAAVKKLPVMQPVLVLADVSMPGKDGYEVCEFVKTSPGLCHVPVLLVGSDLEPYDEQRGARVRADGIIKKPFSPHDLIAIVRRFAALAKAPASPPTPEETPAAAPFAPVQAAPAESHPASAQQIAGEGRAEEARSADVAAPIHLADDIMSSAGQQPHEHPLDTMGILAEPSAPPSEPFPAFVLEPAPESGSGPSHEGASEPAFAASETSAEIPSPAETAEFVLPPQLVDLTALEDLPEPIPALAEPVPEPSPVVAPEPELAAAETAQGVEESKAQQLGELSLPPQLVDLTALHAALEHALSITKPAPEPFQAVSPGSPATGPDMLPEAQDLVPSPQPLGESTSPAAALDPPPVVAEPASASPETSQEWGDLISNPPALEAPAAPDVEWVHKVVHKVVARMAPPVLSPEQVEELTCLLTREIASEIGGSCGHSVFPPERPSSD